MKLFVISALCVCALFGKEFSGILSFSRLIKRHDSLDSALKHNIISIISMRHSRVLLMTPFWLVQFKCQVWNIEFQWVSRVATSFTLGNYNSYFYTEMSLRPTLDINNVFIDLVFQEILILFIKCQISTKIWLLLSTIVCRSFQFEL